MISVEDPAFVNYGFYAAVVTLKLFLMAYFTLQTRMITGVYANTEDAAKGKTEVRYDHEKIERIRRNHLNDLENIPAFLILALLYTTTGASASSVLWHCRVFVWSRIAHTAVYQLAVPQPARAICHGLGLLTNLSMALQIILHHC